MAHIRQSHTNMARIKQSSWLRPWPMPSLTRYLSLPSASICQRTIEVYSTPAIPPKVAPGVARNRTPSGTNQMARKLGSGRQT